MCWKDRRARFSRQFESRLLLDRVLKKLRLSLKILIICRIWGGHCNFQINLNRHRKLRPFLRFWLIEVIGLNRNQDWGATEKLSSLYFDRSWKTCEIKTGRPEILPMAVRLRRRLSRVELISYFRKLLTSQRKRVLPLSKHPSSTSATMTTTTKMSTPSPPWNGNVSAKIRTSTRVSCRMLNATRKKTGWEKNFDRFEPRFEPTALNTFLSRPVKLVTIELYQWSARCKAALTC